MDSDRLHGRLKSATQLAHARVEKRMPFEQPHFDVASYRQLLIAFYGFYRPLEQQLAPRVRAVRDLQWDKRIKLPLLTMDLEALGLTRAEIDGLLDCDHLPTVDTPARAMGCLYVLEGSTLGGQVVQRILCDRLGESVRDALAFFRSYGPNVGPRWRRFLACLEGTTDPDEAEVAALETFDALESWLGRRRLLR
jgi:heme oxygenase